MFLHFDLESSVDLQVETNLVPALFSDPILTCHLSYKNYS